MRYVVVRNSVIWSFVLALVFLQGCDFKAGDHAGEGHGAHGGHGGGEGKSAQITVWTDSYEIFLEHPYLVVNEPAAFVTHVTDIKTLQPRRNGAVVFVMKHQADPPVEHTESDPARDGIYIPELVFEKAGTWALSLRVVDDTKVSSIDLPNITVYASHDEVAKAPDPEEFEGITFLKEQQWRILSETTPVGKQKLIERLALTGVVSACPNRKAQVCAPVAGTILSLASSSLPVRGQSVKAGQVLAVVQPSLAGVDLLSYISTKAQLESQLVDLGVKAEEAKAQITRTQIQLKQAEAVFNRVKKLFEENAKSARDFEEAQFSLEKTRSDLASARQLKGTFEQAQRQISSQLESSSFRDGLPVVELKSPIEGVITAVGKTIGEYAQVQESIFSVLDTRQVYVSARIPEADIPRISAARDALLESPAVRGSYVSILKELGGKIVYLGSQVDANTRTIELTYQVPNADGALRAGMSVNMYVETSHVEDAIVVSESALVDEDGETVAFVQVAGETFSKRYLDIGIKDGGNVQVLDGLSVGEMVVTKGAYSIRLASVSSSIPAHAH